MKSKFLKKIIALAVVGTSISTFVSTDAFAVGSSDFYAWQNMNGEQSSGYWKLNSGKWYYFNYSGTLQTGWIYDKGRWYYADSSGVMKTGVIQINGKVHLFSESGAMQTGNAVINGKYYSFDENGVAVGKDIPTPSNSFDISGSTTVPYTPQMITNEDSSPSDPNTVARDPDNLIKYNVKFKDDDGDEFSTKTIEKDEKLALYKPTKSGYTFVEWTTKKDGDGDSYEAGESITIKKDITLYAQWKESSTSDPGTSTDKVLVEDITVTSTTGTITTKAGTLQMSAKVLPIDATETGVTWSVSDQKIATISSSGLLTAVSNGTVSVVATANDTSKVVGSTNITINVATDSGNTNTGGTTDNQNLGKIVYFDKNVSLTDVVIDTTGDIVDLAVLKASGKLPTKANVSCSLSDGTVKVIEMGITDWTGIYNGAATGNYDLVATLGAVPTGYTKTDGLTMPTGTLKVIVNTKQTDNRKTITGAATISDIPLASDKHIMDTTLLNAAGILPKTVTLNYDGGTVVANVKTWNCTAFDGNQGIKNLVADIESPVGYIMGSGVSVTAKLNIGATQTLSIKELVGVVDGSVTLNYASGDYLKLSDLKVNVKFNNETTGTIPYADFKTYGITTSGYYDGMPLTTRNSATAGIPVTYNNKTVYTGAFKVADAASPTITADTTAIYNTTTPSAVTFNYTLGSGSKTATGIDSVTLGDVTLDKGTDYLLDENSKKLTISQVKLKAVIDGKTTPNSYALIVTFTTNIAGTKLYSSKNIAFISEQTLAAGSISLATGSAVPAKDNTIKLSGLTSAVSYEYCVCADGVNPNWANAKPFTATGTTIELTDPNFIAGTNLYIRLKAVSNAGATNPASNPIKVGKLDATNIGKTLSTQKSIKTFSLKNDANVSFTGTIDETNGIITVVVPTDVISGTPKVMDVSKLTVNFTLSDNATVAVNGIVQTNGSGFTTSPVIYTVTAQDGTTNKDYTVNVVQPALQNSNVRADVLYYKVTTQKKTTVNGVETITDVITDVPFNILTDGYEKAGLGIDATKYGIVSITAPSTFDPDKSAVLDKIRELTPYTNAQIACVGITLTNPYTETKVATKVKVAATLDGLKNATVVSLSGTGTNILGGQYLEKIPVVMYGSSKWSIVTQPITTKYYAWIDSNGNILGYTSLSIKVE